MIELFESAKKLQELCDQKRWRSCVIGGIAVIRWGRPRVTRDVDISILTGFGGEEEVIDTLLAKYPARMPDAREFARSKRVLLLYSSAGTGIDVSLGALPFEEKVVDRVSSFAFAPDLELRTCRVPVTSEIWKASPFAIAPIWIGAI